MAHGCAQKIAGFLAHSIKHSQIQCLRIHGEALEEELQDLVQEHLRRPSTSARQAKEELRQAHLDPAASSSSPTNSTSEHAKLGEAGIRVAPAAAQISPDPMGKHLGQGALGVLAAYGAGFGFKHPVNAGVLIVGGESERSNRLVGQNPPR